MVTGKNAQERAGVYMTEVVIHRHSESGFLMTPLFYKPTYYYI